MNGRRHPFREGDRIATKNGYGEIRRGTVVQALSSQPHITWVDWDNGPRFQMVGTGHLKPEEA